MTASRRLLVAVHDVTPAHEDRLTRIFALLDRLGMTQYALFVVPNWHGEWPLDEHPSFVEELRRRQASGAEIFLHGLRHDEVGQQRSVWQQLRVAGRTASSAEFMFLSPEEAGACIDRGLELFERRYSVAALRRTAGPRNVDQRFGLCADDVRVDPV